MIFVNWLKLNAHATPFLMLLIFLSGEATQIISIFEKRKSLWWFRSIYCHIVHAAAPVVFSTTQYKVPSKPRQSVDTPYATSPNYWSCDNEIQDRQRLSKYCDILNHYYNVDTQTIFWNCKGDYKLNYHLQSCFL